MKAILETLKWWIAKKEMQELERRRMLFVDYHHWFSRDGFEDICMVLKNMEAEARDEPTDLPPPKSISELKFILRNRF